MDENIIVAIEKPQNFNVRSYFTEHPLKTALLKQGYQNVIVDAWGNALIENLWYKPSIPLNYPNLYKYFTENNTLTVSLKED